MKSLAEFNFDWGGVNFPSYSGYMFAAGPGVGAPPAASGAPPAAAPPSSGSTPGATPGVSPPPASSGAPPVASPATGAPTTPPTSGTDPNAANLEVIRKSHELVQRFGGPEKVQAAAERYTKMYDTSKGLATQLGYTPESFEKAFGMDPAGIYNTLLAEAREAETQRQTADGQLDPKVKDFLSRELGPVKSALQQQRAKEANQLVDNDFDSRLSSHTLFKDKSVPKTVKDEIYNRFVDKAVADKNAQMLILQNGDTSGLQPHFEAAVADYFAAVNAHNAWLNGGQATPPNNTGNRDANGRFLPGGTTTPPANTNPFSLDDVIEGSENATKSLPSLRNFR